MHIIRELIQFTPEHRQTNIGETLRYMTNAIKKRCTVFVISDFMDEGFDDALMIASKKHDVVAIQVYDRRESEIPDIGLAKLHDAESGNDLWVDTSDRSVRELYAKNWRMQQQKLTQIFKRTGVDNVSVRTDEDYVRSLMTLFKRRA